MLWFEGVRGMKTTKRKKNETQENQKRSWYSAEKEKMTHDICTMQFLSNAIGRRFSNMP